MEEKNRNRYELDFTRHLLFVLYKLNKLDLKLSEKYC